MIGLLIAGVSLVFAFTYATVGVAVYKVRMVRRPPLEGIGCHECHDGTQRGRGCYHWEHNRAPVYEAAWVSAFWLFVGIALIVARLLVLCAKAIASGPSRTGKSLAAVFVGREDRTKGLQDRIAELEAEDARWKDKFERELGS